jgi:hypothetical protein
MEFFINFHGSYAFFLRIPSFLPFSCEMRPARAGSRLLVTAFQGMLTFFGHVVDLGNLCNGNVMDVDPADSGAFPVHVQHDLDGFRRGFMKNFHQDFHDKIHGGVMVIVQDDPEHARLFEPGLGIHPRTFSKLRLMTAIFRHSQISFFL